MQEDYKVGERIRQIREGLNMNREKFSEMVDISSVFLGQIERGERSLSIKTLSKIYIKLIFQLKLIVPDLN